MHLSTHTLLFFLVLPFAHTSFPDCLPVFQIIFHSGKREVKSFPLQQTYLNPLKCSTEQNHYPLNETQCSQKAITKVKRTKAEEHEHKHAISVTNTSSLFNYLRRMHQQTLGFFLRQKRFSRKAENRNPKAYESREEVARAGGNACLKSCLSTSYQPLRNLRVSNLILTQKHIYVVCGFVVTKLERWQQGGE